MTETIDQSMESLGELLNRIMAKFKNDSYIPVRPRLGFTLQVHKWILFFQRFMPIPGIAGSPDVSRKKTGGKEAITMRMTPLSTPSASFPVSLSLPPPLSPVPPPLPSPPVRRIRPPRRSLLTGRYIYSDMADGKSVRLRSTQGSSQFSSHESFGT